MFWTLYRYVRYSILINWVSLGRCIVIINWWHFSHSCIYITFYYIVGLYLCICLSSTCRPMSIFFILLTYLILRKVAVWQPILKPHLIWFDLIIIIIFVHWRLSYATNIKTYTNLRGTDRGTGPILILAAPRRYAWRRGLRPTTSSTTEGCAPNLNLIRIRQSPVWNTHAGKSPPKRRPHATADPHQRHESADIPAFPGCALIGPWR